MRSQLWVNRSMGPLRGFRSPLDFAHEREFHSKTIASAAFEYVPVVNRTSRPDEFHDGLSGDSGSPSRGWPMHPDVARSPKASDLTGSIVRMGS